MPQRCRMETQQLTIDAKQDAISVNGEPISRKAIREQLDCLIASKHFRNSKRYPAFLRYVVEQTIAGSSDGLKERTLGIDVFQRNSDYDTNADPVVRVTAGEIRKRIAQYYQDPGHEDELRIVLPLGAYVPHFLTPGHAAQPDLQSAPTLAEPVKPAVLTPTMATKAIPLAVPFVRSSLRTAFYVAATCAVVLASLGFAASHRTKPQPAEPGIDYMWGPVISSAAPALTVIGVHTLDSKGNELLPASHAQSEASQPKDMLDAMVRADMVPISDVASYSHITDVLTRHNHAYTTMGAADATLAQARSGPLVLVGGLDNIWTLRLTSKLRYRFAARNRDQSTIIDSQNPAMQWTFNNLQKPIGSTVDYALVASYFDHSIDQPVILIAGVGAAGTQIAAEFMTSNAALESWLRQSKLPPHRNVELVLATEILDGKSGPPRVVASADW